MFKKLSVNLRTSEYTIAPIRLSIACLPSTYNTSKPVAVSYFQETVFFSCTPYNHIQTQWAGVVGLPSPNNGSNSIDVLFAVSRFVGHKKIYWVNGSVQFGPPANVKMANNSMILGMNFLKNLELKICGSSSNALFTFS